MSIIKHVTLQKIVAHDFRYVLRIYIYIYIHTHTHTHTHKWWAKSRYTVIIFFTGIVNDGRELKYRTKKVDFEYVNI